MKTILLTFLVVLAFNCVVPAETNKKDSIYTDLNPDKCKTIESHADEGWYRGECPGVGGYRLELVEGDIRQSINVIAPNGNKSELNFTSNVSSAFSSVGEKAEWRVTGSGNAIVPFALIVRFNTSEDPENVEKVTSRLIVTKIAGDSACITDIVEPVGNANVKARELADTSTLRPCKFGFEESERPGEGDKPLDENAKTDKDLTLNEDAPDLIIADYGDDRGPVWKKFGSEAELEKAREQKESYTIAYIFKKNGSVARVNFTYFSESGDWVEYWFHTYREDGSLAKVNHELRTFMNDIIVNKIRTYDDKGEVLEEKKTFRDLNTQEPIAQKEYMDIEAGQVYLTASALPFFSMISTPASHKNDESAFVPTGWELEGKSTGDLNFDGMPDSVLQIRKNSEEDENDRSLLILFKNTDGSFTKAAEARELLICSWCGGVKGGYPDMEIKNGVLSISQMSGSRQFTQYLHRFRFEPSTGRFLLIGEDISEFDGLGASEATSTNYLTGKQIVTKTKYDEETDKEVVVSSRKRNVGLSKKYIEETGL